MILSDINNDEGKRTSETSTNLKRRIFSEGCVILKDTVRNFIESVSKFVKGTVICLILRTKNHQMAYILITIRGTTPEQ